MGSCGEKSAEIGVRITLVIMMMMMIMMIMMMIVIMTVRADPALDSYQDSMAKYKAWHSKYGLGAVKVVIEGTDSNRIERNVNNGKIFRPHRPRDGGGRFVFSSGLSPLSLQEAELGLGPGLGLGEGPSVFRGTRQPEGGYQTGLGGEEYLSGGTPLYKIKKRFPLGYGRRKRSAQPQSSPWALLDPATGRPVGGTNNGDYEIPGEGLDFFQDLNRRKRRPDNFSNNRRVQSERDAYISQAGVPLYKLRKANPHYGR